MRLPETVRSMIIRTEKMVADGMLWELVILQIMIMTRVLRVNMVLAVRQVETMRICLERV